MWAMRSLVACGNCAICESLSGFPFAPSLASELAGTVCFRPSFVMRLVYPIQPVS
ncbi:hypothetical protein ACSQ49_003473 [Providencia stuartii]|uniref:hypothetical protein n=1 Tax=Providencia stuartii TaxID=588 RepID=UPI001E3B3FBC|nr:MULTISPECIES: hypothetical protein [Providencia]MCL8325748.1 hypothetical protein [Providencia thailandensis]MDF4174727.1 hypothetical protein [Providencia thailandensis]MDN0011654.1 hypothetical protein [Providencia stuartii]WIJ72940.1 hypothetical protein OI982_15770 [Providencia thailandensis]